QLDAPLRLHELARLELVAQALDVLQHASRDVARRVLQDQREVVAAATCAQRFLGAQKEAPAGLVRSDSAGGREALHPLSLWAHGFMGLWAHGFMGLWAHGFMGLWAHGFMGLWAHGFMGLWAHGCMGPW